VSPIEAELDQRIAPDVMRERIRLLYDQLPFTFISNFAISMGLVGLLWAGGHHAQLMVWLFAVLVLAVARALLLQRFKRQNKDSFAGRRWAHLYVLTALMSGSLLGAAGVLFYQDQPLVLFALAVVLGIMSVGSIMMHAAYAPAHLAYVLPLILPFALRSVWEMEFINVVVGVVALLFVPLNLYLAKKIQVRQIESIWLRLRNQVLIQELIRQKELAVAAQAEAERANAARTRFFAAASHDLRQPVQALELFSAALEFELEGHPSRNLVGNIRKVSREFGELINTLLDYSKIVAAVVQPEIRDFPIATMLQRIADDLKPQAAANGLQCSVVSSSAWVRSDPVLLDRIVRNFMTNAIKYTREGKILLGCRRVDGHLRIEVHDTGIGIAQNQHAAVFTEFTQLENPERDRHKGLGLGLAIVDGLAKTLGHPLTLRSQPGRGSMFAVTVPFGASGKQPALDLPPDSAQVSEVSVLLIDDDSAIREAASKLLEKWGYTVVATESTTEALDLLRDTGFRPDVMLVDFRLREGQSGVQAIRAIREFCGHAVPAAIITGDSDPDHLHEAKDEGFPIMLKPLAAAKLRALLSNLTSARPS
jgi:signal transduction histidine kinase